jgi:hypothetical protein
MAITPDFVFICDPGHAWLLVTQPDLDTLGLTAADFSPYTTRSTDGTIALEEDHDAMVFILAWEERHDRA